MCVSVSVSVRTLQRKMAFLMRVVVDLWAHLLKHFSPKEMDLASVINTCLKLYPILYYLKFYKCHDTLIYFIYIEKKF